VGLLDKLFGRHKDADEDDPTIVLDLERRKPQLLRLEKALDALAAEMRLNSTMDNPGWRGRVNEYSRLAGEVMQLRRSDEITREAVLDLVFEVRPVFSGAVPAGMESIGPRQDEAMAAAEDLRTLLPGERR
jgi:hypothetical protein